MGHPMAEDLSALAEPGPEDLPRTLADRALVILQRAILDGTLQPGQRLRIEELGEVLGMSTMPIREALRRLASVGLVVHEAHRGAHVAELSATDLHSIYDARLALEPLAARRAAERADGESLTRAEGTLDVLEEAVRRGAPDQWARHESFHFAVYEMATSEWLTRLIKPVWDSTARYRVGSTYKRGLAARLDEHRETLNAIRAGDADRAEALMYNHLAASANDLAERLGSAQRHHLRTVRTPRASRRRKAS